MIRRPHCIAVGTLYRTTTSLPIRDLEVAPQLLFLLETNPCTPDEKIRGVALPSRNTLFLFCEVVHLEHAYIPPPNINRIDPVLCIYGIAVFHIGNPSHSALTEVGFDICLFV
jgi:hypothetical protein